MNYGVRANVDYLFHDDETGKRYLELKTMTTSSPKLSATAVLNGHTIEYDGHEIMLDYDQKNLADWRLIVWVGEEEDCASSGSATLKVEVLGGSTLEEDGDISSPEVVFGTGDIDVAELKKGYVVYDGLVPQNFKADNVQLRVTVGTAVFTAGKLYATFNAVRR